LATEIRRLARPHAHVVEECFACAAGWWQAAPAANAPGYDPFSPQGSNYHLTVDPSARDPISGTTAHRSARCEVSRIT
jgi:hypothetical protein